MVQVGCVLAVARVMNMGGRSWACEDWNGFGSILERKRWLWLPDWEGVCVTNTLNTRERIKKTNEMKEKEG